MRISGVNIPDNKRVAIALTYIYGIGTNTASLIMETAKIPDDKRVKDLVPEDVKRIQQCIEKNYKVEGELRQIVKEKILLLKDLKTYRGIRHIRRLPVRGQRTKTNSRTVRGNVRKTAGSGKRKVELK